MKDAQRASATDFSRANNGYQLVSTEAQIAAHWYRDKFGGQGSRANVCIYAFVATVGMASASVSSKTTDILDQLNDK